MKKLCAVQLSEKILGIRRENFRKILTKWPQNFKNSSAIHLSSIYPFPFFFFFFFLSSIAASCHYTHAIYFELSDVISPIKLNRYSPSQRMTHNFFLIRRHVSLPFYITYSPFWLPMMSIVFLEFWVDGFMVIEIEESAPDENTTGINVEKCFRNSWKICANLGVGRVGGWSIFEKILIPDFILFFKNIF